jgi:predicted enzyme related to lactoylglutathione lyase
MFAEGSLTTDHAGAGSSGGAQARLKATGIAAANRASVRYESVIFPSLFKLTPGRFTVALRNQEDAMEMEKYDPGLFSWVDLMTKDVEKAKAFYGGLFGWTNEDQTDPDGNYVYTMFYLRGEDVAGMGKMSPEMEQGGMPCVWSNYVCVESVEDVSAKVEAAGGKVMMPAMDIFESGRMAIFTDPEGASFSVWQPKKHIGAKLCNEPGTFCWNELMTRDIDGAKKFYEAVFGWECKTGEDGPYTSIRNNEHPNGGFFKMEGPAFEKVPACWMPYFTVEDIDAAKAKVEELGGGMHAEQIMEIEGVGRFGVFHDDQGAVFDLIQFPEAGPE